MFERFTSDARATVIGAQQHARRLGHRPIGTEHILRAIVDQTGIAATVLADRGVTAEAVEAGVVAWRPSGRDADRELLATIGIDLDAVLAAAGAEPAGDEAQLGRGRRGHIPFCPCAKKSLELALREALRLKDRRIRTEHLLLGILREGQGVACRLLVDRGVPLPELRQDVERALRRTA